MLIQDFGSQDAEAAECKAVAKLREDLKCAAGMIRCTIDDIC